MCNQIKNNIIDWLLLIGALIFFLVFIFPNEYIIIFLNSIFFGILVAILFTYYELVLALLMGEKQYISVWQMAVSLAFVWVSATIIIGNSVYDYAIGIAEDHPINMIVSRTLVIISAVLQVTAPDFKIFLLHSRKVAATWWVLGIGIFTAISVFLIQVI